MQTVIRTGRLHISGINTSGMICLSSGESESVSDYSHNSFDSVQLFETQVN